MKTHYKTINEDGETVFIPYSAVESVHYVDKDTTYLRMKDGTSRWVAFETSKPAEQHSVEKWAAIQNQSRVTDVDGNVYYVNMDGTRAGTED